MNTELEKSNSALSTSKGKLDLTKANLSALKGALAKPTMPRLFYQLVAFILDGSGSMTFNGASGKSKGAEVEDSVISIIERLQNSKAKASYDALAYAYANESKEIFDLRKVVDISKEQDLNPCHYIEKFDRTNLSDTLKTVGDTAKNYLKENSDSQCQVIIIILTDGALHDHDEAKNKIEKLKETEGINVSTILFRSPNWEEKFGSSYISSLEESIEELASSKSLFASTVDPEVIRSHMLKSISEFSEI